MSAELIYCTLARQQRLVAGIPERSAIMIENEDQTSLRTEAKVQQVLTFALAGETYGVDILKVREIRGWSSVTRIPQSAPDVLGVLNLRGAIVPIVDLRARFSLEAAERTPATVIIVLTVAGRNRPRDIGIVVDSVSDVADLTAANIKEAPELGSRMSSECLLGLACIATGLVLLLNSDRLVDAEAMAMSLE